MRFAAVTTAAVVVPEREGWLEGGNEARALDWAAARSGGRYSIIERRRRARMLARRRIAHCCATGSLTLPPWCR